MNPKAKSVLHTALLAVAALAGASAAEAATVTITTPAPVVPAEVVVAPGAPVVHGYPGHPRAAAIDRRIANLEFRVDTAARNGALRRGQAHELHRQLAVVRHNERVFMLNRHLNPHEFAQLQHQLDNVAYNIHAMRHNNHLAG